MSKICQILQVDSLRHKEKLYFLDQLENPQDCKLQILEQIQIWILLEF
jgi:hypothetical protein